MKTVHEMIEALQKFPPEMPIVLRQGKNGGGYIDWELHAPEEFHPGGACCISAFQPIDLGSVSKLKEER